MAFGWNKLVYRQIYSFQGFWLAIKTVCYEANIADCEFERK
jgi:hypothetical protein